MPELLMLGALLAIIAFGAVETYRRAGARQWLRLLSGIVVFCALAPLLGLAAVLVISVVFRGADFGS